MRTKQITIGGKQYWMCCSLEAQIKIEKLPTMDSVVEKALSIMKILLDAGCKWARKQGQTALTPPELEQLAEDFDETDLEEWVKVIQEVRSGERHVEAKPPKKDEGSPSDG